ncbi:hypothetical protein GCM10029992_02170 [Glycomyces albus]
MTHVRYPPAPVAPPAGSAALRLSPNRSGFAALPMPVLLELLRCPEPHHAPLSFDREANCLTCSECDKEFRVEDGIPVMLLDDVKEE